MGPVIHLLHRELSEASMDLQAERCYSLAMCDQGDICSEHRKYPAINSPQNHGSAAVSPSVGISF